MRILLPFLFFLVACSPNNVQEDNTPKKYFDSVKATGTFGLFDNGQGTFVIYNLARFRDSAYLPASTFKVVNSLIGIETGRVQNEKTVIAWDGKDRGRPECNKDMTMWDAFRISCAPWYQELARRIGKDTMQYYLDSLGYGAKNGKFKLANNLDTFWLDNSVKMTADEQLGLMKRLYFGQLPFQKTTIDLVRKMMLFEDNTNYKLSYKTGWGTTEKGNQLGWIIGWIEENKHPYMFVLQLESPDPNFDMRGARMAVLRGILKDQGFFQGKK